MDVSILKTEGNAGVSMSGTFTFNDNIKFKDILALTEDKSIKSIHCNFGGVEFVDSAALGMLMMLKNAAEKKGQTVSIQGVRGQVEKIFKLSKFNTLFAIQYGN